MTGVIKVRFIQVVRKDPIIVKTIRPQFSVRARCGKGVVALVGAGVLIASTSAPLGHHGPGQSEEQTPVSLTSAPTVDPDVNVVQANLESPQSAAGFAADIKTVFAQKPDLITYNEVAYRADEALAPAGYQMFRTPGKYTGETAVAWRTSEWNLLRSGTWMVSNSTAKTAAQKVQLGMRYANWATLQRADGQVISLVSAHTAPNTAPVQALLRPSLERVGQLVTQLAAAGPVVVGGDFNMHYRGARYARDILDKYRMTPTYDTSKVATSTHNAGGIVDYIFTRADPAFTLKRQYMVTLNSDHVLLGADLMMNGTPNPRAAVPAPKPAAKPVVLVNRSVPRPGTLTKRIVAALNGAPRGAVIRVASRNLSGRELTNAILRAHGRGVKVQVLTGHKASAAVTRRLARVLGKNPKAGRFALNRPAAWKRSGLPAGCVMVSVSSGISALRIDSSAPLTKANQRKRVRGTITTTKVRYDVTFRKFLAAAG